MLGLQLKLTPAQVDLLLVMTFRGEDRKVTLKDGSEVWWIPIEASSMSNFTTTSQALKRNHPPRRARVQ